MTENVWNRWSPASVVGTALVVGGLLLGTLVDMSLLVVAGLGAFGPGALRELGWLRDQDELQRAAAQRAGYFAYLVGGFVTVGVFVLASHLTQPVTMILEGGMVVVPFFVLAWAAGRWPRVAGLILLALSVAGFGLFFDFGRDLAERPTQPLTFTLLIVPLLTCGMALVKEGAPLAEEG